MNITLNVAAGLGSELISRLYGSYARRIREIVSNSIDAGAKNFYMNFDLSIPGGKITFLDDGSGMNEDIIRSEFLNIGGSRKRNDPSKIGRIGIGFLAMAGLGHDIKLMTRSKYNNSFQELTLFINVNELFDEAKRTQDITKLNLAEIDYNITMDPPAETFTYIEITNLTKGFYNYLSHNEKDLIFDLRRILPLPYPNDPPLFKKLNETNDGKALISYLNNLNTISFWYRDNKLLTRLVYYEKGWDCIAKKGVDPEIWATWVLDKNITTSEGKTIQLKGYLVLTNTNPKEKWRGLVTRVKNVAVEENGWLNLPPGQIAVRARLTGELFIDGLDDNKALDMDRRSFNYEFDEVTEIVNALHELVKPITSKAQKIIKERKTQNNTQLPHNANTIQKPTNKEPYKTEFTSTIPTEENLKNKSEQQNISKKPPINNPETHQENNNIFKPTSEKLTIETSNKQQVRANINYKGTNWKVLLTEFEDGSKLGTVIRGDNAIYLNTKHPLIGENNLDLQRLSAFLLLLQNPSETENIDEVTLKKVNNAVNLIVEHLIKGFGA